MKLSANDKIFCLNMFYFTCLSLRDIFYDTKGQRLIFEFLFSLCQCKEDKISFKISAKKQSLSICVYSCPPFLKTPA